MKKTFVKLGVLAVALALVFAACAQPTDEEGSSTGHDTILRLWIEDTEQAATQQQLGVGDKIEITLASATTDRWNHATRASTVYQTVLNTPALGGTDTAANTAVGNFVDAMKSGANGAQALLDYRSLTKTDTYAAPQTPQEATVTGSLYNVIGATVEISNAMLTRTKEGAYIDLLLYDTTAGRNQVWQKTGSYYVFLTTDGGGAGALPPGTYVYTKDATSRNQAEQEFPLSGLPQDKRFNGNVKKFSFKNGVNELNLQNFSR